MSTELSTLQSGRNTSVTVTAFSGGAMRGACLQLTQTYRSLNPQGSPFTGYVQLTKEQVVQNVKVMTEWLENH